MTYLPRPLVTNKNVLILAVFPFIWHYLKIATVSEVQNWGSLDKSFSKHSVTLLEDMQEVSIHV